MTVVCGICGKTVEKGHDVFVGLCCGSCNKIKDNSVEILKRISDNLKQTKERLLILKELGFNPDNVEKRIATIERYISTAKASKHSVQKIRSIVIPVSGKISREEVEFLRTNLVKEMLRLRKEQNEELERKNKEISKLSKQHEKKIAILKRAHEEKTEGLKKKHGNKLNEIIAKRNRYRVELIKTLRRESTANKRLYELRKLRNKLRNEISKKTRKIEQLTSECESQKNKITNYENRVIELERDLEETKKDLEDKKALFRKAIEVSGLTDEIKKDLEEKIE